LRDNKRDGSGSGGWENQKHIVHLAKLGQGHFLSCKILYISDLKPSLVTVVSIGRYALYELSLLVVIMALLHKYIIAEVYVIELYIYVTK